MLGRLRNRWRDWYRTSALYRLLNPRQAQLYCVGTAKSGTHSVGEMFSPPVRAAHEPDTENTIAAILASRGGYQTRGSLCRFLAARDRRLWLDVDSSQLNYFFLEELLTLFPKARFLLTIRDPYSWLDSFVNHQLARACSEPWRRIRDLRFRPHLYQHPPEEALFKAKGLYTLDGYLSYWGEHNRRVLNLVPPERLLVVRTDRLTELAEAVAAFAGIPTRFLNKSRSHAFKAKQKFGLLTHLDPVYLRDKVIQHTADVLAIYFPEWSGPSAAAHGRGHTETLAFPGTARPRNASVRLAA